MALRMAEYCLRVYRLFGRFPRQILLYVGNAPLNMETELNGPKLAFGYETVDIRDFDGERLLESRFIGDNVIAILTRLRDQRSAIQRILPRIAALEPADWEAALGQPLRVSGLRELEETVEREARTMPVVNPIIEAHCLRNRRRRERPVCECSPIGLAQRDKLLRCYWLIPDRKIDCAPTNKYL